jgi:glycosyltransferase involved in cell wall biosynthesis
VQLGADRDKIKIVYFGTDTGKFRPLAADGSRRSLELDGHPVILSLRSLEPLYDVASLVRALPAVLREVPAAQCVLVGQGSEREPLTALAARLGVAERMRFAGAIAREDIPRYLAAADVYVSTALSDAGLAASTAEAMACALPVVVTDSGENRAWVTDGEGGFVVPVRDPAVLAEKIITLLKDPALRAECGRHNRRLIEERNNYHVEMQKMERIYATAIDAFGSAAT